MVLTLIPAAVTTAAGNGVLLIDSIQHPEQVPAGENYVHRRCLTPVPSDFIDLGLERENRWSLPKQALSAAQPTVINCLVARFNFQYETTDDPNTTGRGHMLLTDPLANPADSAQYFDSVGHGIDPPPHNSAYFDAHMRALSRYWEVVSDGKITLTWEIWPRDPDSVYTLPNPMSHYGRCDFSNVVEGLENYFVDCINILDTQEDSLRFADYQSIFLFHAGSDRQNDIGFPETCNDLFTGYISFAEELPVDVGTGADTTVRNALMMPEWTNQDNRATAMNAVLAHEFGHQLGLVDLYDTRTFFSQIGDFALMDNNGFGTGVDFNFPAGNVFGTIPLYPCAWSRAFLGFVEVEDHRNGADVTVAAAQMEPNDSTRVVRVPISENEYYLLEHRVIEADGILTGIKQDSATSVIQGPVQVLDSAGQPVAGEFTREYDVLMPGSGLAIWHIDESVAGEDFNNDGDNNFDDNQLQWDWDRRFVSLVEGDGIVNFGGWYRAGWGSPDDLYRDDRNTSFTPNTNPPSIDNTGNNTRVRVTGISRVVDTTLGGDFIIYDDIIRFDVETDGLIDSFPVRIGAPSIPLSPIAVDLNNDGTDEIVLATGSRVMAFTTAGERYLEKFYGGLNYPQFFDTAKASVHPGKLYPVPFFADTSFVGGVIATNPVVGSLGDPSARYVSFGTTTGRVATFRAEDSNSDGKADYFANASMITGATPIALISGDVLWALADDGDVFFDDDFASPAATQVGSFPNEQYHGICKAGDGLILVTGDSSQTIWYSIESDSSYDSLVVDGYYRLGPILANIDRDGPPEVIGFSSDGDGIFVSVDTTIVPARLSIHSQKSTNVEMRTNPIAADINDDGYPEILVGGMGYIHGYDRNLTILSDFPILADDGYPETDVIASPIVADIENGRMPEICFPNEVGNIYAWGEDLAYGFPLSGGEIGAGSPIYLHDSIGGKFGYIGADGWFYLWQADIDSTRNDWPMAGADPTGSLALDDALLPAPKTFTDAFEEKTFYNYPNPVRNGHTTIRYFLGRDANRVALTIYDLSGKQIAAFDGPTSGGVHNETIWDCHNITPGVYRCRMEIDFGGDTETAFTDIAIIR